MSAVADRGNVPTSTGATAPSGAHWQRSTAGLAAFAAQTRFEDLPAHVVHATKRMLLDEIIVTAATVDTPMAQALRRLKLEQGGTPEATLVVTGEKLPAQSVAHVHAQLANLLDADETMLNRMHTVSSSALTALALAERLGSNGRDLIASIAAGFDITARVGLSLAQFIRDDKGGVVFAPLFGWSWMTFGAAATAGRLFGLDARQMAIAFGQALVTAPVAFDVLKHTSPVLTEGVPANWHKYQMCGAASEAGINAARLACFGWIAQTDIFDDGSKFWRSFGAVGCDYDSMYRDLGTHFFIADCAIKPYPFCRFGHAALDLFSAILADNALTIDDIDDVFVRLAPHELNEMLMRVAVIDEGLKLMLSLPNAMALVALGVPSGPKWFSADFRNERLRAFARSVRHEINPEWAAMMLQQTDEGAYFRRLPTEVVVRDRSGREHRRFSEYALGDPWAPGLEMSDAQLADKARRYLDGILPAANIDRLCEAVLAIDRAPDVGAVVAAMVR